MLELAILGLVKEQELHGYELKKRLAETVGPGSIGVSFGSLYPALGRLVAAGALRVVEPGAGSRGKKVYAITSRGEQLFEELLDADAGSGEDERAFTLRLAFARHLAPDARIGMLERRRAFLLARLARTRSAVRHGWDRLDAYTRSLMEHGNETTERDISLLDRLIARERAAGPGGAGATEGEFDDPRSGPTGGRATDRGEVAAADRAVVTASAWAASTAPTMPARPAPYHQPPASSPAYHQPPASPASDTQPARPAPSQRGNTS